MCLATCSNHVCGHCATPCPTCRGERITFKTNTATKVTTVSGFNDEDAAFTPSGVDAAFVTTDGEQDSVDTGVIHVINKVLFPRRTMLGTLAGALGWKGGAVQVLARWSAQPWWAPICGCKRATGVWCGSACMQRGVTPVGKFGRPQLPPTTLNSEGA